MGERIRQAGQVAWAVVGIVVMLSMAAIVAWKIRVIFPPLIFAGAIVFILNPVVTRLQRRHVPRVLGTAISYLAVLGLFIGLGFLIAPQVEKQADDLSEQWPELRADVEDSINDVSARSKDNGWFIEVPNVEEIEDSFGTEDQTLSERIATVREVGARVFEVGLIFVLAPIIAFYFLVDLPHLRRVTEELIPEASKNEVLVVGRRLSHAIGGFFRGQLCVALIVGTMVSIGLAIIGLPFWLIIGMIAGLFNLIPLIGPWVGAVPGIIIALTTRDFGTAIWVAVVMSGAQQVDNHFISPLVMQRAVKLHPAAVMLALLAGGTLGGFFGLLLAVPTTAVLKILIGHTWRTYVLDQPFDEVVAHEAEDDAQPAVGIVEKIGDDDEPVPDRSDAPKAIAIGEAEPAGAGRRDPG